MNKPRLLLLALLATTLAPASLAAPIAPSLAYSENANWINFSPSHGGVEVAANGLSGFAWAENIGWIKLGSDGGPPYDNSAATGDRTTWGVNHDGAGNLSGYAWSEAAGWINFSPTHSSVMVDPADNSLLGFAWGENIGWISFEGQAYAQLLIIHADGFENPPPP